MELNLVLQLSFENTNEKYDKEWLVWSWNEIIVHPEYIQIRMWKTV